LKLSLKKLKPGVNFINILREHFSYKSAFLPKSFRQSREKLCEAPLYEKFARKMLMGGHNGRVTLDQACQTQTAVRAAH